MSVCHLKNTDMNLSLHFSYKILGRLLEHALKNASAIRFSFSAAVAVAFQLKLQ
jgi:hypothetical protein